MTRTCYLCAAEIIDAGTHSACLECGMSYPHIPAVEPAVSAPAASPRLGLPAAGQLTGEAGACSSRPSPAGPFLSSSASGWQARAEAASRGLVRSHTQVPPGRGNIRATIALLFFAYVALNLAEIIAYLGA